MVFGKPKQKKFSAGSSQENFESARRWLVSLERASAGLTPEQPTTLQGVVDAYLEGIDGTVKSITKEGYDRSLRSLSSTLGPRLSPLLTQQTINLYAAERMKEGAGRGIAKELSYLRSALNFSGIQPAWNIPHRLSKIPKKQSYVPQPDEVKALLDGLDYIDSKAGLLLALLAGLRDEEVYRVTYDMIDQKMCNMSVPGAIRKTGVDTVVPICETLYDILEESRWTGESDAVIELSKSVIRSDLLATSTRLGIHPWYGFQPARRCLVTWAEDAGFSQDTIALVTGHARASMVSSYSSSNGRLELKRQIIEAVEERIK